ncbi:MAG TPA: M55 family metallopeptidase [Chloroflexota bacterium]|nr:M55 family metallopeptidase [Chloroflexota bacterium]
MKVYISTDFEGVSGIVDWAQVLGDGPEYQYGRALLMDEVNAAIDGAMEGGATEFVVNDSHHTMRNLTPRELHGRAALISGRHKPLYMMEGLDASAQAIFFIGYHGSIGADPAILSHSYNPSAIWEARLDGQIVGESGLNALVAAHFGVPIALVSGDEATAREAESIAPLGERVVVKQSISRFAAHNLHPEEACALVHAGAKRAVERIGAMGAPRFAQPTELELTFLTADMAAMAAWVSGVVRKGTRQVVLEDTNTLTLFQRFVTIVALTRSLVDR